jgi:hypothetical protein
MMPLDFVRALDELVRADLQAFRDLCFNWLLLSSGVVAFGVILEGPEVLHSVTSVFRHREDKTPRWVVSIALFGWILVALGVAGEGVAEGFVSKADGILETFNNILLTEAQVESGHAIERAAKADERASENEREAANLRKIAEQERLARIQVEGKVAWRRLSDTDKNVIGIHLRAFLRENARLSYDSETEGESFAVDIALSLQKAKWNVSPPSRGFTTVIPAFGNPIQPIRTGVEIATTDDTFSIDAGKALYDELCGHGFDASLPTRSHWKDSNPLARAVWVTVHGRPEGPQGEAKLRGNAKYRKQHK